MEALTVSKVFKKGIFNAVYTTRNNDPMMVNPYWTGEDRELLNVVHFDESRLAELLQNWILECLECDKLEGFTVSTRIALAVDAFQRQVKRTKDEWHSWDLSSDEWLWCSNCDRVWNREAECWDCIDCGHTHEKKPIK